MYEKTVMCYYGNIWSNKLLGEYYNRSSSIQFETIIHKLKQKVFFFHVPSTHFVHEKKLYVTP